MNRRPLLILAGAAALTLAMPAFARAEPHGCEVPPEFLEISVKLPHLAERLHARQPVKIVAIGGASTRGAAAGAPDLAYPHRLQVALAALYPELSITVVNKGVPRQSTQQMVERFPTDVIAEDPILVVWEAGISDAVRGIELDDFAAALQVLHLAMLHELPGPARQPLDDGVFEAAQLIEVDLRIAELDAPGLGVA